MPVVNLGQERPVVLPHVQIRPVKGLLDLDLSSLWHYRELIYILVWRDVTVRYKQTLLGVAWAMFQPIATMLIFTVVFSVMGKIPSDGTTAYPVFLYAGLLPWFYVSQALSRGGPVWLEKLRSSVKSISLDTFFPSLQRLLRWSISSSRSSRL